MKYLVTAVAILAALCLGLLLSPLASAPPQSVDGSLVVNQKVYLPQELETRLNNSPYYFDNKQDILTDIIYRELLLQEAKKQKINSEEGFRRAMRDFYEQSMIKLLLDRQYQDPTHKANAAEVEACLPLLKKTFKLVCYSYADRASALIDQRKDQQELNEPYLNLPEDAREGLMLLKGGSLSGPLHSASGWYRLQLTGISPRDAADIPLPVEQESLCQAELQRQSIHKWLETLYQKSKIQRPTLETTTELNKGGNHG